MDASAEPSSDLVSGKCHKRTCATAPPGQAEAGIEKANGGGHCRQPCIVSMGLHAAAPATALFTGIAFGDGSPETALAQHRINLGLFDPPYLAPLPALGSDGSESRRCGCAGPLPIHGESSHRQANPASPHTALSPHGSAVDHAPFGGKLRGSMWAMGGAGIKFGEGRMVRGGEVSGAYPLIVA